MSIMDTVNPELKELAMAAERLLLAAKLAHEQLYSCRYAIECEYGQRMSLQQWADYVNAAPPWTNLHAPDAEASFLKELEAAIKGFEEVIKE